MFADRTVLKPDQAEVQCLELHPRNPDCREEVARAAPYDNIVAQLVAETPREASYPDDKQDYENHGDKEGDGFHPTFTYDPPSVSPWAPLPGAIMGG